MRKKKFMCDTNNENNHWIKESVHSSYNYVDQGTNQTPVHRHLYHGAQTINIKH